MNHITISNTRSGPICKETESWAVSSTVNRFTHNGWPATCRLISTIAHNYKDVRDELTSENDLLFRVLDWSLLLPSESFLHDFHKEHTGITKCQLEARWLIYWPGNDRHVEEYIKYCPTCKLLPVEFFITMMFPKVPGRWSAHISMNGIWQDTTHHGLFIQVSVLISNMFDNCECYHWLLTELFASRECPWKSSLKMDNPLKPRNGTPSQSSMASNMPLHACTTLTPAASLKGMSAA